LFRWDWKQDHHWYVNPDRGDKAGEIICLYFVIQRKGYLLPVMAPIDQSRRDEEEQALYRFISNRWQHLKELWVPVCEDEHEAREETSTQSLKHEFLRWLEKHPTPTGKKST